MRRNSPAAEGKDLAGIAAEGRAASMPLIDFVLLATFFGFALFAATSSVFVLAAEPETQLLWWSALLPVALTHWISGFLATWSNSMSSTLVCAATTILATVVAAWVAYAIGPWMPRDVAVLVLIAASIAGMFALGLSAWLRLGRLRNP